MQDEEVTSVAEHGEEAGPTVAAGDTVEAREDLALQAGLTLLVSNRKLLPVHHLRRRGPEPQGWGR